MEDSVPISKLVLMLICLLNISVNDIWCGQYLQVDITRENGDSPDRYNCSRGFSDYQASSIILHPDTRHVTCHCEIRLSSTSTRLHVKINTRGWQDSGSSISVQRVEEVISVTVTPHQMFISVDERYEMSFELSKAMMLDADPGTAKIECKPIDESMIDNNMGPEFNTILPMYNPVTHTSKNSSNPVPAPPIGTSASHILPVLIGVVCVILVVMMVFVAVIIITVIIIRRNSATYNDSKNNSERKCSDINSVTYTTVSQNELNGADSVNNNEGERTEYADINLDLLAPREVRDLAGEQESQGLNYAQLTFHENGVPQGKIKYHEVV